MKGNRNAAAVNRLRAVHDSGTDYLRRIDQSIGWQAPVALSKETMSAIDTPVTADSAEKSSAEEALRDPGKPEKIEISFRFCFDGTVDAFARINDYHKACGIGKATAEDAAKAALSQLFAQAAT